MTKCTYFLIKSFVKLQCGAMCFNPEKCLMHMNEKWHKYLDNGGHDSAFLIDLWKAFDSFSHHLMIAKLNAFGVGICRLSIY